MLDSVLDHRAAAYASGPLQTGRLYYEARAGRLPAGFDVRKFNGTRLSRFARQLRDKLPYPVIDPGLLVVDSWTGGDYLDLYLEILGRYAKEIWFIDGWQYSSGATAEYRAALEAGMPCLDSSGERLSPNRAEALISGAVDHIGSLGLEANVILADAA